MSNQFVQDPLVGLAINPGPRDIVLPGADELRALGPKWIRYLLHHQFQDFQTGQNSELDFVINRFKDLGVNILVLVNAETLGELPPAHGSPDWSDALSGYIGRVAAVAGQVAAYYGNKIAAIEVFNEPDIQEIVPEDYGALLAATCPRIKRVSNLPVISAGISYGENFEYLRRVIESAQGAFDGVGWHPYAERVDGYPAADWGIGELRESLTRARAIGGKPLWITEIGAELGYTWPEGVASADAVAEYLRRAYRLMRELGADTVAHTFWFTWRILDAGWGLVDGAGSRRSAWYAFQQETLLPVAMLTRVAFSPTTLDAGQLFNVSITVKNNSDEPLATQGPNPGFVYEEGESFYSRDFPDINGAFRVGVDFEGNSGVDHPYRWGLGAPLAPGETTTVSGAIRLKTGQSIDYWAGLVRERIAWLQDRQGIQRVTVQGVPIGKPRIVGVTFTPTTLDAGQLVNVSITVKNNSSQPLITQGPDPGFVYEEGDSFYSRGFPDVSGAFRVGIDFDGRSGIDHPYRWGLGTALAPGQTTTIAGTIRLKTARAVNYWAGLVREQIAWLQDREGIQLVMVRAPSGNKPQIVGVTLTPISLEVGQLLNVSITIRNNSTEVLSTQGPAPGFVYEEGETFYTRGFPDVSGAFRVGIDFDGRSGVDHPYRWGLGEPLAPGQTVTVTGAIRLDSAQARNFWAGLVREQVAWLQDQQGKQRITVTSS